MSASQSESRSDGFVKVEASNPKYEPIQDNKLLIAFETHKEYIMRETLCVKMVDNTNDGHAWYSADIIVGRDKMTIWMRKATPEECGNAKEEWRGE